MRCALSWLMCIAWWQLISGPPPCKRTPPCVSRSRTGSLTPSSTCRLESQVQSIPFCPLPGLTSHPEIMRKYAVLYHTSGCGLGCKAVQLIYNVLPPSCSAATFAFVNTWQQVVLADRQCKLVTVEAFPSAQCASCVQLLLWSGQLLLQAFIPDVSPHEFAWLEEALVA